MSKLPKFLIAKNELASLASDDIFIVHTQEPKFIAKVVKTNAVELLELQQKTFVNYKGKNYNIGAQTMVKGQLYAIFVVEFLSEPDLSEIDKTGSGGLMSRMGDWFHNYIKITK